MKKKRHFKKQEIYSHHIRHAAARNIENVNKPE